MTTAFTIIAVKSALFASEPPSSMPAPTESFEVGILHIDCFGRDGEPIILIPGLAGGSWVWRDTILKLSPTNKLYVITLPGFDGRPPTKEAPLFDAFARDFWILLTDKRIDKPVIVGHSLGGTLAIALAEERPQRLAGIVAVDGLPVFPMVASATPEQRKAAARQMAATFESMTPAQLLAAQQNYMKTIGTKRADLVEPVAKLCARSDAKAIAAWLEEDLTHDLRPCLGKITIPFLEIMPFDPEANGPAKFTQEQTLAFYTSLVKGAPQVRVVPIAPSRHFVMLDQPETFHKTVAEFLKAARR